MESDDKPHDTEQDNELPYFTTNEASVELVEDEKTLLEEELEPVETVADTTVLTVVSKIKCWHCLFCIC
jgi:hypothetical protein